MSGANGNARVRRLPRAAIVLVAGLGGFALAAIGGIAAASTFTLKVEKNAHDTNAAFKSFAVRAVNKTESIAVGPAGFAVYTFQGETTHHIICKKTCSPATNCWGFWPPVSVTSAKGLSKQTGIKGKLGTLPEPRHPSGYAQQPTALLLHPRPDVRPQGHRAGRRAEDLRLDLAPRQRRSRCRRGQHEPAADGDHPQRNAHQPLPGLHLLGAAPNRDRAPRPRYTS